MNYLTNLPNDIHIAIYKHIFDDVLIELKYKINGILQIKTNVNEYLNKLEKTLINKLTINIIFEIDSNIDLESIVNSRFFMYSIWDIPVKSFQNQHIFYNFTWMEYTDFYIFDNDDNYICNKQPIYKKFTGDTWQDIYETADYLIVKSLDEDNITIKRFEIVNETTTIRLITDA